MNVAIIGYGRMGKTIEKICLTRNHNVSVVIDIDNKDEINSLHDKNIDVAIEFTQPHSAFPNIRALIGQNIPVVCGTTAWTDKMEEIQELVQNQDGTFFYAPNYSIGVNLFFAINEYVAKLMNNFQDFDVSMEEIHHIHKLDSPSGTALNLAHDILTYNEKKTSWTNEETEKREELSIISKREPDVAGIHSIFYEGPYDKIECTHTAKSREGFALGSVLAAEWVHDKKGIFSMKDFLKQFL
ncbi:4-hydroxy-tetrahydrodipicolinate reductase [Membranihabitans maritimus]|uniref:4-hydroxy-tetrahydrodipicolinate reductase n=1 Tax=Membranihabitans maritimus TaxID=2904244 RepID=UPI001EFFE44F|nr:4-hydroxy-tetrahydrodipicolinate reductase [Membranihabitans maritimus]